MPQHDQIGKAAKREGRTGGSRATTTPQQGAGEQSGAFPRPPFRWCWFLLLISSGVLVGGGLCTRLHLRGSALPPSLEGCAICVPQLDQVVKLTQNISVT